ncbi:phosphatase PAP2 family protein [Spiroplasma endosymbiont of Cantharis nigra]|uniref:phosphatase PAP2 family protein n=1 Tax=Spiroplasma endosymbiont of Cantharis nigra TaxID=3066278 RepID=UPI0030D08527
MLKNKYLILTLFLVILTFFILSSIFDLRISKLINESLNKTWFTSVFDTYGRVCLFFPIYLFLFIFLLKFLSYLKTNRNVKIVYVILFNLIYFASLTIFLYFKKQFSFKNNSFDISKFSFSIFLLVLLVIFIIFINIYLRDLFDGKNNYINIYFQQALSAALFISLLFINVGIFKILFGRNRPYDVLIEEENFQWLLQINFSKVRGSSFPSGHTAAAGAMLSLIYFLDNKRVSKIIFTISIVSLILLTGISRVLMSKHFLTDVLFSILLVSIYYFLSKIIVKKIYERKK